MVDKKSSNLCGSENKQNIMLHDKRLNQKVTGLTCKKVRKGLPEQLLYFPDELVSRSASRKQREKHRLASPPLFSLERYSALRHMHRSNRILMLRKTSG